MPRLRRSYNARNLKLFAPFAAALVMAACNAGGSSVPPTIDKLTAEAPPVPQWQAKNLAHRACPEAGAGEVQCDLLILNKTRQGEVDVEARYEAATTASSSNGSGQIVAIVDAYDNPTSLTTSPCTAGTSVCRKRSFTSTIRTGNRATTERQHELGR